MSVELAPVRFYSHRRGEHACFSNFHPSPIVIDGLAWPTVEHYFQACKSVEPAERESVRLAATPREAKRLGRRAALRPDWDTARVDAMRAALRAKFTQHASMADVLVRTGDAPLIEASPTDYVWGEGADGTGENMLGKLLMELRSQLRAPSVLPVDDPFWSQCALPAHPLT